MVYRILQYFKFHSNKRTFFYIYISINRSFFPYILCKKQRRTSKNHLWLKLNSPYTTKRKNNRKFFMNFLLSISTNLKFFNNNNKITCHQHFVEMYRRRCSVCASNIDDHRSCPKFSIVMAGNRNSKNEVREYHQFNRISLYLKVKGSNYYGPTKKCPGFFC